MEKDQRIIEKEAEFAMEGIRRGSYKPDYNAVLVEGGATPRDIAYLTAYNVLLSQEPALARVVAEAYFFNKSNHLNKEYEELYQQKEEAFAKSDFDLAANLRDRAEAVKRRIQYLTPLLEVFAEQISNRSRGLETVTGEK